MSESVPNEDHVPTQDPVPEPASGITFQAPHLDVSYNPDNPPPAASSAFIAVRNEVKSIWEQFNAAVRSLVALDDKINEGVLSYISENRRATRQKLWHERCRLTLEYQEIAISKTQEWCRELQRAIEALQAAADKEAQTLEAQATFRIDVGVMKDNLKTSLDIIEEAKAELQKAKGGLEETKVTQVV
jgi:hypothetical protein